MWLVLEPKLSLQTARGRGLVLLLLLSHVLTATPARSWGAPSLLQPVEHESGWPYLGAEKCGGILRTWRGMSTGLAGSDEATGCFAAVQASRLMRLRGGAVDNTRYYEVLKLPVGEEDENVSAPSFAVFPFSCCNERVLLLL